MILICRKPLPWEKRWRQSLSGTDRSNSGPVLRPGSGPGDHDHDDDHVDVHIDDWQTGDEIVDEHYVMEEDTQPTSEKMARKVGRLLHWMLIFLWLWGWWWCLWLWWWWWGWWIWFWFQPVRWRQGRSGGVKAGFLQGCPSPVMWEGVMERLLRTVWLHNHLIF